MTEAVLAPEKPKPLTISPSEDVPSIQMYTAEFGSRYGVDSFIINSPVRAEIRDIKSLRVKGKGEKPTVISYNIKIIESPDPNMIGQTGWVHEYQETRDGERIKRWRSVSRMA